MANNRRWKNSSSHRMNPDQGIMAPASTGAKSSRSGAESVFGESTVAANLDFLDDMLAQSSSSSIVEGGGQRRQPEQQDSFESFNESDIGSIMDFVENNNASHSNESSSWKKEAAKPSWDNTSKDDEGDDERLFTSSLPSLPSRASSRNNKGSRGGGSATNNSASSLQKQEPIQEEANPAVFETTQGEDDVPPVPFFGGSSINDRGNMDDDDDDTISQITSSIASHSYYDASSLLHGGGSSRNSGGFFRKQKSSKLLASTTGESSFADTLDEIADLMNPTNHSGRPGMLITTARSTDKLQSYIAPNDLYRHLDGPVDGKDGSMIFASAQRALSGSGHLLAKFRLQLRYLQSRILPRSWRSRKSDGEDEDYYNMLMKHDRAGPGEQGKGGRGANRMQRQRTIWTAVTLLSIFCGMTLLLLVLRVAMMHAMARVSSSKRIKMSSAATPVGKTVRGGMSVRGGMAGGISSVRGGMARHSVEGVVTSQDNVIVDTPTAKKLDYSHLEHVGMDIPQVFNNLHDVNDFPVQSGVDIPFHWHIPRTGGGTVNDIFGGCLSKTLASDAGGTVPEGKSDKVQVVKLSEQFSYVNVDTSNPIGIQRAKSLGLASSGLADLIVSPWLHEASELFTPNNKGRLFTIFRHPVERAVSLFHYVQDTQWRQRETFNKELSGVTIEEYFKSGKSENNWMTRFLIKELTKGELTQQDVNLAKEVLRRKALVLLLSEKGESFSRLEHYLGWQLKTDEEKECHEKKLQWAWPLKHRHDEVEEGTPLWDLIMSHNLYDMELYEYAKVLFQEQGNMFH